MHLISRRVATGLEVNPSKMSKKDASSKNLKSPSETSLSRGPTASIKKTLRGGSSDAKKLHLGKGVNDLKH
jgi:hypothetical protein